MNLTLAICLLTKPIHKYCSEKAQRHRASRRLRENVFPLPPLPLQYKRITYNMAKRPSGRTASEYTIVPLRTSHTRRTVIVAAARETAVRKNGECDHNPTVQR